MLIALAARVAAASRSGDADGETDDGEAGEAGEAGERDDATSVDDSSGRRAGAAEADMKLSANAEGDASEPGEPGEGDSGEGERAGDASEPGQGDSGDSEPDEVADAAVMPASREISFSSAAGLAGTGELTDPEPSPARSSRWGRFDLSVAWRRTLAAPAMGPVARADELWLLASWSR